MSDSQKNMDQLRAVLTRVVESGDIWRLLPEELQNAAMAQFLRLENEALAGAEYGRHPGDYLRCLPFTAT